MIWNENKKTVVDVVFVLDVSGSMKENSKMLIDGFNENIQDMRADKNPVDYRVTLITFSNSSFVQYSKRPLSEVTPLTSLFCDGGTALFDAVGDAVMQLSDSERVMIIVITDGENNSSRRYSLESVKKMVEEKQNKKWAFTFLGASLANWSGGQTLGFKTSNFMSFDGDYSRGFDAAKFMRTSYSLKVVANAADVNDDLLKGFEKK
jgi:Mg-chelatase subunit ChlD